MSKALWGIAAAIGALWLVSQVQNTPTLPSHSAGYSPGYATPEPVGAHGRFGDRGALDFEDDDRVEEIRQAKQDFEDAADELRTAVEGLRYNRWDGQISTIRSQLEDADDALTQLQLESLHPDDPAVQSARDEVDNMRSHLDRLHFENWRTVRPDLDSSSSLIEDEAIAVSEQVDEDGEEE